MGPRIVHSLFWGINILESLDHCISLNDFQFSIASQVERNSIAIVEDDEDSAYFYKEALSDNRFKVVVFTDSTSASKQIRHRHSEFILVLSDIRMPRINGIELIKRIYKTDNRIKFILMSAFDLPDIDTDSPMPPHEFIQKPVSEEKLKEIVYRNANQN